MVEAEAVSGAVAADGEGRRRLAGAGARPCRRRARQELEEGGEAGHAARRAFTRGAPRAAQGAEGAALYGGVLRPAVRAAQGGPLRQAPEEVAGRVRLPQRRGDGEGAGADLRRALRRPPRRPARGRLCAGLARDAGRTRLEGRDQGVGPPRATAALLGVESI